jgi:hypothetical protein
VVRRKGTLCYTAEIGRENWIIYEEFRSGRQIARQSVPKRPDFHCNLRFKDADVFKMV